MKTFGELTHLGKGQRLRPLAHAVLGRFGIEGASLRQVKEAVNVVFRVRVPGGDRCVLRMTPPWHFHGVEDVHSEITWLQAIADETDIGIPAPLATTDAEYVVTETWPQISGEWHCVLFSWIPGTDLARRWTMANIERFGRLSARLHEHARTFAQPAHLRSRRYDHVLPHGATGFSRPEPRVLFDGLDQDLMPRTRRELFRRVAERVQVELDQLFSASPPQLIHNDLHPWNVMVGAGRLWALDFENCLLGFPVQDVGTTLHYVQQHFEGEIPYEQSRAAFRRGYESARPWPEQCPGQVDTMVAAHRLLLSNFYASHEDPEYREFAVTFIERMERRLRDYLAHA